LIGLGLGPKHDAAPVPASAAPPPPGSAPPPPLPTQTPDTSAPSVPPIPPK
jgi:hypothetical protein